LLLQGTAYTQQQPAGLGVLGFYCSASACDSKDHNIQYTFDWGDGTQTQTGWVSNYQSASVAHSWTSGGIYSVSVRAQCSNGQYSSWSSPISIAIGSALTVYAVDQHNNYFAVPLYIDNQYVGNTGSTYPVSAGYHQVAVENNLYGILIFNCYYHDGYYDGSNPLSLTITAPKTITACYYNYLG
jgi:hypothetical protein